MAPKKLDKGKKAPEKKGKPGADKGKASKADEPDRAKAGALAEAKGPTTRLGIISEFFRKLLLPLVLRFNNLWNWLFAKDSSWRQVVVLTILFFLIFQFLYHFCLYDLAVRLKSWAPVRKGSRRVKRMLGRCCSLCKSIACLPFSCVRRARASVYHHIVFLPSDVQGPRGPINPGHKLISTCISEAKESIDGCLFMISHPDLTCLLVEAQMRGVAVRLIMDQEFGCSVSKEEVDKLKAAGVQIFPKISPFLMHHKFVVVDRTVLVNGSFNWSVQGLQGNHENLLITNNPVIVLPYYKEFVRLRNEVACQLTEKVVTCGDTAAADAAARCYM